MKLKLMSDLHNEFGMFDLQPDEHSKDTVLILAGDIDLWQRNKMQFTKFIEDAADFFYHVIFIAGNHEFYNGDITHDCDEIESWVSDYDNIHFLENSHIEIDGVVFIGTTMWTDMKSSDPVVRATAQYGMNDFRKINIEGDYFTSDEWIKLNTFARNYVERKLREFQNKKCVVITHHGPSEQSIAECYSGQGEINFAYVNTLLEPMIEKYKPVYWFHGHTHVSHEYKLFDTTVMCNPRGYHGYEVNPKFNPDMLIEV